MDIQSIAAVAGFFVGVAYVIGGLIVNIHLSRYGLTEYGILRVTYLVVGLVYIVYSTGIFLLAGVLSALIFILNPFQAIVQLALLAVSFGCSIMLLWFRNAPVGKHQVKIFTAWLMFSFFGAIALVFPIIEGVRHVLVGQPDIYSGIMEISAILALILGLVSQVYFYAHNLYGQPDPIGGTTDLIGMGIPIHVQLAIAETEKALLAAIGIPIEQDHLSKPVVFIDETDNHYIIGIEQEPKMRVVKIVKDAIKGIVYLDVNAEKAPPASGHQTTRADHS